MSGTHVVIVADPDAPTAVAEGFRDHLPPGRGWDLEVVSAPFTEACEDIGTAVSRLRDHADDGDVVVGLTELPLRADDGRYLLVASDPQRRAAVLSLPALGGPRLHRRARAALREVVGGLADVAPDEATGTPPGRDVRLSRHLGRWRLLLGMVLANRPWLLVPGLKTALVAALTTGAIATINSSVWMLAGSMSTWRLVVASVVSNALVAGWLVVDGELWDRPADDSPEARDRSRLYNASTLTTLTIGVVICYAALYLLNLLWALFVLDPSVMSRSAGTHVTQADLFVIAWFVASAATVGGGLGSGLESDEAIRTATYSRREQDRRRRLADQRDEADERD